MLKGEQIAGLHRFHSAHDQGRRHVFGHALEGLVHQWLHGRIAGFGLGQQGVGPLHLLLVELVLQHGFGELDNRLWRQAALDGLTGADLYGSGEFAGRLSSTVSPSATAADINIKSVEVMAIKRKDRLSGFSEALKLSLLKDPSSFESVPIQGHKYNCGSQSHPFRKIYIQARTRSRRRGKNIEIRNWPPQ